MEARLLDVWKEVLPTDQIGVTNSFFELGGDSLLAIKLESRLIQLGFDLNFSDILKLENIRALSLHIFKKQLEKTNRDISANQGKRRNRRRISADEYTTGIYGGP